MYMSSKIKILPKELIDQIAAGEVVERPASVVKELVENSLDAGAKNITIEIENGGINLVKIIDDGCGMSAEDARLAIAQHATSKISSVDDLYNIQTLGFRGEALASIASVSEFELITKQIEDVSATCVKVVDNKVEVTPIGAPSGTSIAIKNLFYNIPVRKKYLKTSSTEFNNIIDLFLNYVLGNPEINFKLLHNGKKVYQFSTTDTKNRFFEVLGADISDNLLPIDYNGVEMRITGFIGKPQIARNNRRLQYLFINNRPVGDYVINKRIKDAYETLIPNNLFPVFFLFLQVDPTKVDVNVHPRKLEVRFSDPQKIYQTIYRAVADTLDSSELVKNIKAPEPNFSYSQPSNYSSSFKQQVAWIPSFSTNNYSPRSNGPLPVSQSFEYSNINQERAYKILGQVQNSYIIVEDVTGVKIYDQHACSERLQYEKIKKQWQSGLLSSQKLLLPETLDLPANEALAVRENLTFFQSFGFDLNEYSNNTFAINSVPQLLSQKDYKNALHEIIEDFINKTIVGEITNEVNESTDRVLKMMSCRSAIKFGDSLTMDGMYSLIDDIKKAENPYTCVHGRPCVIEYSFVELEKLFKRRT